MGETLQLLTGVKIAAFTTFLIGPAATQYLADMGADVVKVEEPVSGSQERRWSGAASFVNGVSTYFLMCNRNIRSIGVDIKHPEGRELAVRLCEWADVVVTNFRPGVMERLRLGYKEIATRKPDTIYACASGYGSNSPHATLPGQDLLIQARSGLMAVTGKRQDPPTAAGAAVIDQHAAALLAMGVLGALYHKAATGHGQYVEVNMIEAAFDLQSEGYAYHLNGAALRRPESSLATSFHEAPYGIYRVDDGYVAISMSPVAQVSEAIGSPPELKAFADPDYAFSKREEIASALAPLLSRFTKAELLDRLTAVGVWCAPVNDYGEALDDPVVKYLEPVQEYVHSRAGSVKVLKHPITYGSGRAGIRREPPALGQDTTEVLHELGIQADTIDNLRARGVVR